MLKKIIYSLIIISVGLLLSNIIVEIINKKLVRYNSEIVSASSVEKKFLSVLNSFALKPEWIKKTSKNNKQQEIVYYTISLPKSIKTPILLDEIVASLENNSIQIIAQEKSIGGNIELKIYNNSKLILNSKFVYDEKLDREIAKLSLILLCDEVSKTELEKITSSLPVYHLLFPLNDEATKIASQATLLNLDYSLLINDDISSDFEIDESENKKIILAQLDKIFTSFPRASAFIIDQNSSIYLSKIYPLIQREFHSRGKPLIPQNRFHTLVGKNYDEQISLLHYYCSKYANSDVQNILIPYRDIIPLHNEIYKAQLKGHQFVEPLF
ncbi:MAG: hypothetical protein Fur0015_12010 [Ignavibacteriales bacterium]